MIHKSVVFRIIVVNQNTVVLRYLSEKGAHIVLEQCQAE